MRRRGYMRRDWGGKDRLRVNQHPRRVCRCGGGAPGGQARRLSQTREELGVDYNLVDKNSGLLYHPFRARADIHYFRL